VSIMEDPMRRDSDRLKASELLAEHGWGRAAQFQPHDGDPLDLGNAEQAAEEVRAAVLRLAGPESE
jgi:hypothetical protein